MKSLFWNSCVQPVSSGSRHQIGWPLKSPARWKGHIIVLPDNNKLVKKGHDLILGECEVPGVTLQAGTYWS